MWFLIAVLGVVGLLVWLLVGIALHGLGAMMGSEQGHAVPRNVGPGPNQDQTAS